MNVMTARPQEAARKRISFPRWLSRPMDGGRAMRHVLAGVVALTAAFALGAAPVRAQGNGGADKTVKAQDFMNTFGVNIHFFQNNYSNTQSIADALNYIGFSRVRSRCSSSAEIAAWNDLASKVAPYFPGGLRGDALIVAYNNEPTTFANQRAVIPQIAGILETIEGPNEINSPYVGSGAHGPFDTIDQTANWPSNYTAWAQAIYNWKQGVSSLASVKILAPTIASGDPNDYNRLPNVSAYVDAGTIHFYAGAGRQPSNFGGGNFSPIFDWYKAAATPSKPVSMTECGQTTSATTTGASEATQAKYILNQLMDATAKGVYRAYLYQLMDDSSDGDPSGGNDEAHYGLFNYQWQPKPAAQALANLKSLLADTTTNFTPNVPTYTVSGVNNAGQAGSSLAIARSDGSSYIVVWNEPQIWDSSTHTAVTPPNNNVTVNFGVNCAYQVYDPLTGVSAISSGNASSVVVNVLGSPLLIKVTPGSQPDLIVTNVTWSPVNPAPGQNVTFSATIKNQGNAATPAGVVHGVSFLVNGAQVSWSDTSTASLAAGASRTLTAIYGPNGTATWTAGAAGKYTVRAWVDDVNRIAESDENNNTLDATLTVVTPATGTGLRGTYFNNKTLSGASALSRTDATVNFNWGTGSYASGQPTDNFSARWEGQVEAPASGSYTFTTNSDDGVRLWVNGTQLVNNWTDHGPTDNSGTISLTAGQRYSIRMEYYENTGGAVAKLDWAYPSQARQNVPKSRLYPAVKLTGTVIGTLGSWDANTGKEKAFDGDFNTYFDAPNGSNVATTWVGLDLGAGRTLTSVRFAPRSGFAYRMVGGKFQASNTADFSSGVVDLFTVGSSPPEGILTAQGVAVSGTYRYVRFIGGTEWMSVAELEFWGD